MLKQYLLDNWEDFTKTDMPRTLQIVPITSCLDEYGNDIVLIFVNKFAYPSYILKVIRNHAYGSKLLNEFFALKALKNDKNLSHYIPTPFYSGSHKKNVFFLQEGMPGHSLFRLIRQKGMNKKIQLLINKSIDLLVDIGRVKLSDKAINRISRYEPDGVFNLIEKDIAIKKGVKREITRLKEYQQQFIKEGGKFFVHGDYWQTNILVDSKKEIINGVIDWEFSQAGLVYPKDIIWFIINLGYNLHLFKYRGSNLIKACIWAFYNPGAHNKIIASFYDRYMTAIGWDKNLFRILLKMTLAEMSVRELGAYGRHYKMDYIWLEILDYAIENEGTLCIV